MTHVQANRILKQSSPKYPPSSVRQRKRRAPRCRGAFGHGEMGLDLAREWLRAGDLRPGDDGRWVVAHLAAFAAEFAPSNLPEGSSFSRSA